MKNKDVLALKLTDVIIILLINLKKPTIVGILILMSRFSFMFCLVELDFVDNIEACFATETSNNI